MGDLVHGPAHDTELPTEHRPREGGSFDATVVTFAAMGLFDSLEGHQRAQVLLPHTDPGRTHWNFLPESGRHGLALRAHDPPHDHQAPPQVAPAR